MTDRPDRTETGADVWVVVVHDAADCGVSATVWSSAAAAHDYIVQEFSENIYSIMDLRCEEGIEVEIHQCTIDPDCPAFLDLDDS